MLFPGKIYTAGTKFTRPPVVTVATNFKSVHIMWGVVEVLPKSCPIIAHVVNVDRIVERTALFVIYHGTELV